MDTAPSGIRTGEFAPSLDPLKTLHHEVIHALPVLKLALPKDGRALSFAKSDLHARRDIEARYPT